MSSQTSLIIIAICQLLGAITAIAAVSALIYGVFSFKRMVSSKMDEAMAKVQPVVDHAQHIAEQAKATADNVSSKVDAIMTRAEDTADQIGNKMQEVSDRVEEAITPQIAVTAGVVGAVVKAVQLYQDVNTARRKDGQSKSDEQTMASEE